MSARRIRPMRFKVPAVYREGYQIMTDDGFTFAIKSTPFNEDYRPADNTRITTNFANLARGASRQENLRNTLRMIDNRFNSLAHWDNPGGDRYSVDLTIISVEMNIASRGNRDAFPLIEMLETTIVDKVTGERLEGITGNNFSSYVRDYDFSIVLPGRSKGCTELGTLDDFGDLHGNLFKHFLRSSAYRERFRKPPVICLSVSSSQTYHRTGDEHAVLGIEYKQGALSPTDRYFAKMGMQVRFFMPMNSAAPLAFYFIDDLPSQYTNLELVSTISTMETFQKIYRPEIYNANSVAAKHYRPSLKNEDYSLTRVYYDREERSRLAVEQGKFAEERFIKPYAAVLERWTASCAH